MLHKKEAPSGVHFGYLVVISLAIACFIPLSLGLSCAGIFYPAISESLGVSTGLLSYYTSILWLASMLFLPLMGKLLNEKDARLCLGGAVTLIALAFVWLSFTQSLWQFYLGAFCMGIGVGMLLFLAPSTLINRWFEKWRGLFLGVVMAFTGIGGVVWSSVGGALINAVGWSFTYVIFAAASLLTLPFMLFAVRSYPQDINLMPVGYDPQTSEASGDHTVNGMPASKAFKTPVFALIFIMCLLLNFGMYLYFMIPSYLSELPVAAQLPLLGATASSIAMAGQTVSKFVFGYTGDKKPYLSVISGLALGIVGCLSLLFCNGEIVLIYVGSFMYGVFYGVTNVMTPILTRISFGNRDYSKIYSRISMAASIGSMVSGFFWGALIDATQGFTIMFVGIAATMAVTMLTVVLIMRFQKQTAAKPEQSMTETMTMATR